MSDFGTTLQKAKTFTITEAYELLEIRKQRTGISNADRSDVVALLERSTAARKRGEEDAGDAFLTAAALILIDGAEGTEALRLIERRKPTPCLHEKANGAQGIDFDAIYHGVCPDCSKPVTEFRVALVRTATDFLVADVTVAASSAEDAHDIAPEVATELTSVEFRFSSCGEQGEIETSDVRPAL